MPRTNDLAMAVENRRGTVERLTNAAAQYFKVTGEVEVSGTGEAIISVLFPVYFIDKPRLSTGHELGFAQPAVAGNLPVVTTCVLAWNQSTRNDGTIIYAGMTLGIVSDGPDGQVLNIQWHVEGVGIRGPIPTS